jgi:hypothetical protein
MDTAVGILLVTLAGLVTGSCLWPIKLIRRFQFEHYWFVGMLPLVILPWSVVLATVADPGQACAHLLATAWKPLMAANLLAIGWGIANVLAGLCVVRIGFVLSGAILTAIGLMVVTTLPMIVKGSGQFRGAPDLTSPAGVMVIAALAVMLVGLLFTVLAGFGRERVLAKEDVQRPASGGFLGGLVMAVTAGVLSAGMPLAFVYGQGPIIDVMQAHGAGRVASSLAVWATGLLGGSLVNIIYPAVLITKNKSWGVLGQSWREIGLSVAMGTQLILAFACAGYGALLLGALGASVGFGIQQAMQIVGGQGVGFASGEWRGVHGKPRGQIYFAILLLAIGVFHLVYAKMLT